jgi:hypothetical protein
MRIAAYMVNAAVDILLKQTCAYLDRPSSATDFVRCADRDTVLLITNLQLLTLIYKLAVANWKGTYVTCKGGMRTF